LGIGLRHHFPRWCFLGGHTENFIEGTSRQVQHNFLCFAVPSFRQENIFGDSVNVLAFDAERAASVLDYGCENSYSVCFRAKTASIVGRNKTSYMA
jgi:hypothetical protein